MLKEKNKIGINDVLILLILSLQVNMFDLFPSNSLWGNLNSDTNKYLILLIFIVCFLFKIMLTNKIMAKKQNYKLSVTFFWSSTVLIMVLSSFVYSQRLTTSFMNGYYYLIFPLMYCVLGDYLLNLDNFRKFVLLTTFFGTIESGLYVINSRFLQFLHPVSTIDINNELVGNRVMGFIRYQSPADFVFFASFLLSVAVLFKIKKINLNFFLCQGLMISYIFFVSQVRTYFLLAIILLLIDISILIIKKVGMLAPIFVIILILIFLFSLYILILKLGFFEGNRISSLLVRTEAIPYYLRQTFNNEIFGIGFPNVQTHELLIHGYSNIFSASLFYIEDTGVFGIVGVFGILGILYFIMFLKELVSGFFKTKKRFEYGIVVVIFMGLFITLIPLNVSRIVLMAWYLILLDFIENNVFAASDY